MTAKSLVSPRLRELIHGDAKKQSGKPGDDSPGRRPASKCPPHPGDGTVPEWPDLGKGGQPSATCTNARHAIEMLDIECRYDLFHDRKLVAGQAIEQWAGEFSDHACQMLRVVIKENFGFDPGKDNTNDAQSSCAYDANLIRFAITSTASNGTSGSGSILGWRPIWVRKKPRSIVP
jgi:hypothetical protein